MSFPHRVKNKKFTSTWKIFRETKSDCILRFRIDTDKCVDFPQFLRKVLEIASRFCKNYVKSTTFKFFTIELKIDFIRNFQVKVNPRFSIVSNPDFNSIHDFLQTYHTSHFLLPNFKLFHPQGPEVWKVWTVTMTMNLFFTWNKVQLKKKN